MNADTKRQEQGMTVREGLVSAEGTPMTPRLSLVDVILRLSSSRSFEDITRVFRESARYLIGADGITVVLRDNGQCSYVEEDAIAPLWKGKRFPMSACISGWCMLNGQQVVIRDIYQDDRIPHDAYRPTFVKSLAMTPIRTDNPIGAIGAYWDAEYEPSQEQLRMLQALGDSAAMALENAQLIAALRDASERKDAFLSMLAHELRNPLAPIRNGIHLLQLQGREPEIVEQACGIMERQVVHMTRIVDDLLDVARINNGKVSLKRGRTDIAAALRQCVGDRRQQIESVGLTLKFDVPMTPVWINADTTRMTQVVGNLLDNARKYTPAGGTVTVSARVEPASSNVVIDVQDTGVGIAPKVLPHVFESFTQADTSLDRTAGGLGLGLAIAKGLVRLHDGTLSAHSNGIGQGSRFTVTLPRSDVARPAAPTPTARPVPDSSLRLLIIEDNKDSALTLQKLLKVCGYSASVAYDGDAGVDMARAEKPDVVLCDIGLPKRDGYAVASALRESDETSNMRLIAVTGYGSDDDHQRSRQAGFDAHLTKPINLQELLGQIKLAS